MANPVDPNEVPMPGENSFIRLTRDAGRTLAARASNWRSLWCPAGAGTVLFLQSELTDNKVRIYSDNPAVARWLQKTIEALLFPAFADTSLPVIGAEFARGGDARPTAFENNTATTGRICMAWWDNLAALVLANG